MDPYCLKYEIVNVKLDHWVHFARHESTVFKTDKTSNRSRKLDLRHTNEGCKTVNKV
jgi:hypothetical protein